VTINRTQALVIGFVVLAWLSLLGILIARRMFWKQR